MSEDIHSNGKHWIYTKLQLLMHQLRLICFEIIIWSNILIIMVCSILEREFETPANALVSSFLFQCNLFKVLPNTNNSAAQCLVCKKNGGVKYCKGKNSSNYKYHLKVFDFSHKTNIFNPTILGEHFFTQKLMKLWIYYFQS